MSPPRIFQRLYIYLIHIVLSFHFRFPVLETASILCSSQKEAWAYLCFRRKSYMYVQGLSGGAWLESPSLWCVSWPLRWRLFRSECLYVRLAGWKVEIKRCNWEKKGDVRRISRSSSKMVSHRCLVSCPNNWFFDSMVGDFYLLFGTSHNTLFNMHGSDKKFNEEMRYQNGPRST
jgi:hypothetical protein